MHACAACGGRFRLTGAPRRIRLIPILSLIALGLAALAAWESHRTSDTYVLNAELDALEAAAPTDAGIVRCIELRVRSNADPTTLRRLQDETQRQLAAGLGRMENWDHFVSLGVRAISPVSRYRIRFTADEVEPAVRALIDSPSLMALRDLLGVENLGAFLEALLRLPDPLPDSVVRLLVEHAADLAPPDRAWAWLEAVLCPALVSETSPDAMLARRWANRYDGERRAALEEIAEPPGELVEGPWIDERRAFRAFRLAELARSSDLEAALAHAREAASYAPAPLRFSILAAELEMQSGLDADARNRLEPLLDRLSQHARLLLGVARARTGDAEGAVALLEPLVAEAMPAFRQALASYEAVSQSAYQQGFDALNAEQATPDWYARYEKADESKQDEMVDDWINEWIQRRGSLAVPAQRLRETGAAVDAAFELGLAYLALRRLDRAESVFMEIHDVESGKPEFDLAYGKVLFWLGRRAEGDDIFNGLVDRGDATLTIQVADAYRDLGERARVRDLTEAVYARTDVEASVREYAAHIRTLVSTDLEDRVAWAKLAGNSVGARAYRLQAEGGLAGSEGRFSDAADAYRQALALEESLPESSVSLNNRAIQHQALAAVTGDPHHLAEACRLLREALRTEPDASIVLSNLASQLYSLAGAQLWRDRLRADVLRETPNWYWGGFDPVETAEQRTARQDRCAPYQEAISLLQRHQVVAPSDASNYVMLMSHYVYRRQGDAAEALLAAYRAAAIPTVESERESRRAQEGIRDPADTNAARRAVLRATKVVEEARAAGHEPTLARALCQWVEALAELDSDSDDRDARLAAVEEAVKLAPCPATWRALAAERLICLEMPPDATEEGFLWLRAHLGGAKAEAEAELVLRAAKAEADLASIDLWMLLSAIGEPRADDVAAALRANPAMRASVELYGLMAPQSSSTWARRLAAAVIWGDEAAQAALLAEARERGLYPTLIR